jgi:hypothetical protein
MKEKCPFKFKYQMIIHGADDTGIKDIFSHNILSCKVTKLECIKEENCPIYRKGII